MNQREAKPLIILTGPTAVGKTSLSVRLAKAVDGEIISADSMQVYRGMDIGTAKVTQEDMCGVRHYLIDELEPTEDFNVALFQKKCREYMQEIYEKGRIPILVGGTGFYIQSVLYDINFTEESEDDSCRMKWTEYARVHGPEALHRELMRVDPESADQIHCHNVKRVIRALEYYERTGQKISEHNQEQRQKESPYDFIYYVLRLPREILYRRIEQRVDLMREQGLVEEVRRLQEAGCTKELVSMQGLGYKEILLAFSGEITLDEAFDRIKQETRHFAKRQFTWFRRERNVTWLDKEDFPNEDALLSYCVEDIRRHFGA